MIRYPDTTWRAATYRHQRFSRRRPSLGNSTRHSPQRPNWVGDGGGVLYSDYRDGGAEEMGLGNGKEGLFAYPPHHHNPVSPADSFNKTALGLQERLATNLGSVPRIICSTTHSKAMILPGVTCERPKGSAAVKCPCCLLDP